MYLFAQIRDAVTVAGGVAQAAAGAAGAVRAPLAPSA
jgi:hypothetical protein